MKLSPSYNIRINPNSRILRIPSVISNSNLESLLDLFEFVFINKIKFEKDFYIDMRKLRKASLLGQLLIYKFMSYTVEHECFQNPRIFWSEDSQLDIFKESGFAELMDKCFTRNRKNLLFTYNKFPQVFKDNLFISPQILVRDERDRQKSSHQDYFISKIANYYDSPKVRSTISTGVGELIMNFWEHATKDSGTIALAKGNKDFFELILADNGQGIISTIKTNHPNLSDKHLMLKVLEKGITSKTNTFHMGSGLWIIKELTERNSGVFDMYSEGIHVQVTNKHVIANKTPFWKGTITYWKINIESISSVSDFISIKGNKGIKLNIVGEK